MAARAGTTWSGEGRHSLDGRPDYLSGVLTSGLEPTRNPFSDSRPSARATAAAAVSRETDHSQEQSRVEEMASAGPDSLLRGPRSSTSGAATGLFSTYASARATTTTTTSSRQEPANHYKQQEQPRQSGIQPLAAPSFNFEFSVPASPSLIRLSQQQHQQQHHGAPTSTQGDGPSRLDAYRSTDLRHPPKPFEPGYNRAVPALPVPLNEGALHNQHPDNPASKRPPPAHLESSDSIETHIHKRRQTLTDADKPIPVAAPQQRGIQQSPRRDGVGTSPRTRASVERRRRLSAAAAALRPAEPIPNPAQPREVSFLTTSFRQGATRDTTVPETTTDAHQAQPSEQTAPVPSAHAAPITTSFTFSRPGLFQGPADSTETIVPSRPGQRRAPASSSPDGVDKPSGSSVDASKQAPGTIEPNTDLRPAEDNSQEAIHTRRDLLPLKTVQRSMSDDKRSSFTRRPPVSYKPPVSSGSSTPNGNSASIPPIRGFRSSGSRRSLTLDMNLPSPRNFDNGDDYLDANHRDRSLRALEGRTDERGPALTPPDSALADTDDSGDVFLRIARQEAGPSDDEGRRYGDARSEVSRPSRPVRRPMSAAVNTYDPNSPPRLTRRMSEQENGRSRDPSVDVGIERLSRQNTVTYRGLSRERASEDARARSVVGGLRGSPMTPRTLTFQDATNPSSDSTSPHSRRRQHSVDTGYAAGTRVSSLKQSGSVVGQARNYSSSPLAPKAAADPQAEAGNVVEGTNSTTSTAAPSTVWDELDDLKSRIHRLELTGKLPPTSGAAISRATDERPPTAHTNATTMSASPKRGVAQAQASDAVSTTSSSHPIRKESHPVLHNALAKSKSLLSPEVYAALEAAAKDALSLTNMMGSSGQPGPISSAASGVGGSGPVVTDRQLRRKADSVCRSITELCIALSDGVAEAKAEPVAISVSPDKSPMTSPTVTRFTGLTGHARKPSTFIERSAVLSATSPRAASRLEDKRTSVLMGSALPSPRYNNPPVTIASIEASPGGRKSSLLLSRTRRAQTEEPEEARQSLLFRTRRAGTEEPEEASDRRSSLMVRGRRAGTEEPEEAGMRRASMLARTRRKTMEGDEDLPQLRTPSRAITEVAGVRSPREYMSHHTTPSRDETMTLSPSALPKRQLTTTSLASRIVQPTPPSTMASRRFLERSTERAAAEREVQFNFERDEMPTRRMSLAQPASLNRAGSLTRRTNRESMIAMPTSASGARTTTYR